MASRDSSHTSVWKQGTRKLRTMRPAQIRREMARPFRLVLLASSDLERQALSRVFVPTTLDPHATSRAAAHLVAAVDTDPARGLDGAPTLWVASSAASLALLPPRGARRPAVIVNPAHSEPGLLDLLRQAPEYRLALARTFPPLRELLARELIRAVAGRNAAVAALSALTEVIPTPLSLVLALGEMGSDTILITANQMSLAFQLAAVRGAEVGWRAQSRALLAIAAGGLGWRALARELVGLIPAGVGLAAKTGIAYSGTMAVGQALWRLPQRTNRPRIPAVMPGKSTHGQLASRRQTA